MVDISSALQIKMQENQCSPIYAFFLISDEGRTDGVRLLQSQSTKESSGRLRNQSNIQTHK